MTSECHNEPFVVALVPARGGSKGLSRKNLRPLLDRPLIAHSIRAGFEARLVNQTFVSTEDGEIAQVARDHGAKVITRPRELAEDDVQNDAVALHALEQIGASGDMPDILILLQPTSPLRTAAHVDECVAKFLAESAASAMSICPVEHHPGKFVVIQDGLVAPFTNDHDMEARRQTLAPVYRQNGAIYAVRVPDFVASGRFYCRPCLAYIMSRMDSVDIDSDVDLELAELFISRRTAELGA